MKIGASPVADKLKRFAVALRSESHHLLEHPELLWQQMHNRLQWAYGDIARSLRSELAARTGAGAQPWVRTRTRFVESKALSRTLSFSGPRFAASPDGSFVVSAAGKELVIHNLKTGALRVKLRGHTDTIHAFDLSPLGDKIVSASKSGELKLWDLNNAKELMSLHGHTSRVRCCSFSPDGSFIVSAGGSYDDWNEFDKLAYRARARNLSPDRLRWLEAKRVALEQAALLATAVMIWDVKTGETIATLVGTRTAINACSVSPDSSTVVTAEGDTMTIWDLFTRTPRVTLSGHREREVILDCVFSPEGRRLVSASSDHTLKVWDAQSGREQLNLEGHNSYVYACGFNPDGSIIVSGSGDGTLKLWNATTGRELATLQGHGDCVTDCGFSGDGSWLLSSSIDQTLKIWDMEKVIADTDAAIEEETAHALACAISADAKTVVAACKAQEIDVLKPDSGERKRLSVDSNESLPACLFSCDGRSFLVYGWVFDATTLEQRTTLCHNAKALALNLSPDGSYVVTASYDKKLRIWDAQTGAMLRELEGHTNGLICLAISPDGRFIVSGDADKDLWIWKSRSGKSRVVHGAHRGQIVTCTVSPDTSFLVTSHRNVKVWDTRPLRERHVLIEDEFGIFGCAISPASDLIAVADSGGTIGFWDPLSGKKRATCIGCEAHIAACAFTPDGKLLVSAGSDAKIRVWRVENGTEVATLPLPAGLSAIENSFANAWKLTLSPLRPRVACVDLLGNLNVVDLEGISYGPRIVTAWRRAWKLSVRCPGCGSEQMVEREALDSVQRCAQEECGILLKVNPFTIRHPADWGKMGILGTLVYKLL